MTGRPRGHCKWIPLRRWIRGVVAAVFLVVAACTPAGSSAAIPTELIPVDSNWQPVLDTSAVEWSPEERGLLNAALHFVAESLPTDDPRRDLMRRARYVSFDKFQELEGMPVDRVEATYSMHRGIIYVKRPTPLSLPWLATNLAHELHHMERDNTESVNRMHECDRERVAHAREAQDIERMIALVSARSTDASQLLPVFELARAQALSLSAMYTSRFEFFRLVQAMDKIDGLRNMTELYSLYERVLALAEAKLSTDTSEELSLLSELSMATRGSSVDSATEGSLARARAAVEACVPLHAEVERRRATLPAHVRR